MFFAASSPANAADSSAVELRSGDLLGPYRIEAKAGAGSMGKVYRATDTRLGRVVAVKVCQSQFTKRFEREAKAIAALKYPNICQIYDVGANYIVMEWIDGAPIVSAEQAPQAPEEVLRLARRSSRQSRPRMPYVA